MNIAVLGPEGTFCDSAYIEYSKSDDRVSKELEAVYANSIDEEFEFVGKNCAIGIAPIENTLDGYVQRTIDLLLEKEVHIIDDNLIPVQFSAIANAKTTEEIEKLYVQFKANGQCRRFINKLNTANIITTESNMQSYYSIGEDKGAAAIVPAHIAKAELGKEDKLVIENVTDAEKNYTRFAVFADGLLDIDELIKNPVCTGRKSDRVRIPVCVMPQSDRPGLLFEILKTFNDNKINLISIMSRPTRQEMGTYNFYMEIDAKRERLDVALKSLKAISEYNDVKILGIYGE